MISFVVTHPWLILAGWIATLSLLVAVLTIATSRWIQERRARRQAQCRDRNAAVLLEAFARDDEWRGFDEARARYEAQQKKTLSQRQVS